MARTPVKFRVLGPYKIPVEIGPGGRVVDRAKLQAFWAQNGQATNKGCYVFAVRGSRSTTPWYVGKTTRGFASEAFTEHKLNKYSQAFIHVRKGTPILFLLVSQQRKGKPNGRAISALELDLINAAFQVNDRLQNDRGIEAPIYEIEGIGSQGKPTKARQIFVNMIGW